MNGFVRRQLVFGNTQPVHKYKECTRCNESKPPEGGIQLSQTKWHCARCWANGVISRKLKDAKTQTA